MYKESKSEIDIYIWAKDRSLCCRDHKQNTTYRVWRIKNIIKCVIFREKNFVNAVPLNQILNLMLFHATLHLIVSYSLHFFLHTLKCVCVCFVFYQHRDWILDSAFEEHWWNLSLKQKSYAWVFLMWFFHNRAFFWQCFWGKLMKSKPQTKTGCLLCFPTPRLRFTSCGSGFQFRHQVPYLEIRKRRG